MKKFIVISLMAALAPQAEACIWSDTSNSYLFSPLDTEEFSDRVNQSTLDNWQAYTGATDDYYSFRPDDIIAAARRKGDALMVSYVGHLQQYLDCAEARQRESWDYPTKAELAARRQTLSDVRAYAQSKLGSRLRSQHALLFMRCNMMLGRHQENVQFWQQTASRLMESVYRDMMRNIYAGALLQTGHDEQAARIFAEQGDWRSLMTQYYKRRSCQAISQEYQRDPNSPVLPFLLGDFVNNAQEAKDALRGEGYYFEGKLFIRDISKAEARQMCQLAARVVAEGKSKVPMLWQSAKAWLEYMDGNHRQGLSDIMAAAKMKGTERMAGNTRVLMLYMTAAQAKPGKAFDDYLATELAWLGSMAKDYNFYYRARERVLHQVLVPRYAAHPVTCAALLRAVHDDDGADDYFDAFIDTMQVDRLRQYISYAATPATTPLDRYLKPRQHTDADAMNDLVGTKYLRLRQWQQAEAWLAKVPLKYYSGKGYAVYAVHRSYTVEPWVKRQWLKEYMAYDNRPWTVKSNPKLSYAREMQKMEAKLSLLTGKARQQCCYDLAVRYAQAHFTGDCWYIMRDGKSLNDSLRQNEADLAARARELLAEAALATNFALRERALFALSYGGLHAKPWQEEIWDERASSFVKRLNTAAPQFKALTALARFEQQNAQRTAAYVSRCDNYRQFRKTLR